MKKLSSVKTRNSNIELLRVMAMLMIVAYHYSIYGFYAEDIIYTANKSFVDIFGMGGKIGTDIFVMISGYYMVRSRFTLRKLISLMGQLWYYTIVVLLIFTFIKGLEALSFSMVKSALFPILTSHYWFASYYVLLMLMSPFINAMLLNLRRGQHALLALFMFLICTVLPEFFGLHFADGSLWLFFALYVTAAWFRLYLEPGRNVARKAFALVSAILLLCVGKIILSNRSAQLAMDVEGLVNSVNFLGAYSPIAFLIAALLLVCMISLPARQDKAFFVLGGTSFGVYLFHANIIVNEYLYQDVFHTSDHAEHPLLFVHAIVTVFVIYAMGTVLDLLRQKTVAPLWNIFADKAECFTAKFCAVRVNDKTEAV